MRRAGGLGGEHRRVPALAFAHEHPRAVLLGEPGGGKTTFANMLALGHATELLGDADIGLRRLGRGWTGLPLVPIRVSLRHLAVSSEDFERDPGDAIWAWVRRTLPVPIREGLWSALERHVLDDETLFVLDGYDEVPEGADVGDGPRARVKSAILGLARAFPRARILLTSRIYAYRAPWTLPDFQSTTLAPLSGGEDGQQATFVDRWYRFRQRCTTGMTDADRDARAADLKTAIESRPDLEPLAERPLLLALMATLHAARGGTLPGNREALYGESVDLLLEQWQSAKEVADPAAGEVRVIDESVAAFLRATPERVHGALQRLAFEVHAHQDGGDREADIPVGRLAEALAGIAEGVGFEQIVEYVRNRAGLLNDHGDGIHRFPHRTFQEYLAARHLANQDDEEIARHLTEDPDRWREAFLLAGANIARHRRSSTWTLIDEVLHDPRCAARATDAPGAASDGQLAAFEPDGAPEPSDDAIRSWQAVAVCGRLLDETDVRPVEGKQRQRDIFDRLRDRLAHLVGTGLLEPRERVNAGIALGRLGDPRPHVTTLDVREPGFWSERIPAGSFWMGSRDGVGHADERPRFECTLIERDFAISRHLVTVAQYQDFVDAGGYTGALDDHWTAAGLAWRREGDVTGPGDVGEPFETPNHPRVGVSWYEAVAFCRWLAETSGLPIHLPTEPQWERAARSTDERTYPWGDDDDDDESIVRRANVLIRIGHTSAVGAYPASRSVDGAADLCGNVVEWCQTVWLSNYDGYNERASGQGGPDALEGSSPRVVRGGAWDNVLGYARAAVRDGGLPNYRYDFLGFRVCLSPFSLTDH